MKGLRAVLFLVATMVFVFGVHGPAYGQSSCEFIKDPDRRNYCRAISQQKVTWCEFIKAHDLRRLCRVEVKIRDKKK